MSLSQRLSRPELDDLGEKQGLEPLFPEGVQPTLAERTTAPRRTE